MIFLSKQPKSIICMAAACLLALVLTIGVICAVVHDKRVYDEYLAGERCRPKNPIQNES